MLIFACFHCLKALIQKQALSLWTIIIRIVFLVTQSKSRSIDGSEVTSVIKCGINLLIGVHYRVISLDERHAL